MKNLHANATEPTAGRSGSALQSFIGALFLTLILSVFAPHGLAEPIAQLNESGHDVVQLPKGKVRSFQTVRPIGRLVVGDSAIAEIRPLSDRTFYILAKKEGSTSVTVFGKNAHPMGSVDVEVTIDVAGVKRLLRERLARANISVDAAADGVILSGDAPDAIAVKEAEQIVEAYGGNVINSVNVTTSQQVQLEVRFVEVSRTAGRELGVNWSASRGNTSIGSSPSSNANSGPFGTIVSSLLRRGISADALVTGLEKRGMARRLAEPNLVALSGQTASFLAGGEFPIPVASDANKITIEFKKFGVGLEFTPTVLKDSLINLTIEPEVSTIDPNASVQVGSIQVPGISVRRVKTSVELHDGQSFVIAGLIKAENQISKQSPPWLGKIPILGALFRSTQFQRAETDLVIIITPRLVKPISPNQPVATPIDGSSVPNDAEIFLVGLERKQHDSVASIAGPDGQRFPIGHQFDF